MDKIFFWWTITTLLCLLIGLFFNMSLAILFAVLMIPMFIHDIILKFCRNYETKQEKPTLKE